VFSTAPESNKPENTTVFNEILSLNQLSPIIDEEKECYAQGNQASNKQTSNNFDAPTVRGSKPTVYS
jgi:hypothetical protein